MYWEERTRIIVGQPGATADNVHSNLSPSCIVTYKDDNSPLIVSNTMVVGGVKMDGTIWGRGRGDVAESAQVFELYAPSFVINVPTPEEGWTNSKKVQCILYDRHVCPVLRLFSMLL